MTKRLTHLDWLRIISVALVMYGHFVLVAGGAKLIPNIINNDVALPLINEASWRAYLFEVFLVEHFSTQSAVLGVSVFFLITGYLMPMMTESYSRKAFIANRVFRIFPTLAAAILLIGAFLYFTQGLTFPLSRYLSSFSLIFFYTQIENMSGVLWTLAIELLFYFIAFMIGRFTEHRLVLAQSILLFVVWVGTRYPDDYYLWVSGSQARYLLMITIGSAVFLSEKRTGFGDKLQVVLPSLVMSFVGFQVFNFGRNDPSTYETLGTHLLALSIFLVFQTLGSKIFTRTPRVISVLSSMVYPLYLIHAAIGLSTIAVMRQYILNPYLLVLVAVLNSMLFAYVLHVVIEKPGIQLGRSIFSRKIPSLSV